MPKEIIGIIANGGERLKDLKLNRRDIFVSDEHSAFTCLGSRLYGLFVVHKDAIREARDSKGKTSEMRLNQMIGEETEKRYLEVERVWGREIPRDKTTSNYLTKQLTRIINEH